MGKVAQPSGTVTFLFTDVQDHTRLWEEFPDAMRVSLERHDEILRGAIGGHGGYVFSTAGDAFSAAFSSVDSALGAVVDAQQGLRAEGWPTGCELRVRMGLHTGEAQERDGDYFGPAVIRAARLMSLGHGGQVLVSGVTADLIGDRPESAIAVRALGEVELRGLGRVERVSEVRYPGLAEDFPPLASREPRLGKVPRVVGELIGRDDAVAAAMDLVSVSRLATLVGPGGVGKTRLSIEVASFVADQFGDGVWFVPLATVTDESAVPNAVAEVLGVQESAGRSLSDSIVGAIAGRDLLLILDNCEHVTEGVRSFVDAVVNECRNVVVLATSREPLAVPGERVLPVQPLPVDSVSPSTVAPAVDLFVIRARAADPTFGVDEETRVTVSEVCRRLDGMPLAIELAAARVRGLGLDGLADHLDDRFRLLRSRGESDPRHQTLRATVGWSYDMLDDRLRKLFCRARVFAGGFTRDAAEEVLAFGRLDSLDVADGLAELVDKSMLQVVDGDNGRRYRMLETMRQFSADVLDAAERRDMEDRFLRYYADWCEAGNALLQGSEVGRGLSSIHEEFDNIREAFRLALDEDALDAAAAIVVSMYTFATNAVVGEPWAWADELADRLGPDDQRFGDVLMIAVWGCRSRGDRVRAESLIARYQTLESSGDLDPTPMSDRLLGTTYWFWRQTDRAVELQERSIAKSRVTSDPGLAMALGNLSMAQDSFDRPLAERTALEALAIGRERGNAIDTCIGLLALAGVVVHTDPDEAVSLATTLVDVASESGVRWHEATGTRLKAHALSRAGDLEDASGIYARAIELNGVGDYGELLWYTVVNVIEHLWRIGDAESSAVALGALSVAPAAPSDDLIARATERFRARLVEDLGAVEAEAENRGRSLHLADLLRLLHEQLVEHARAVARR